MALRKRKKSEFRKDIHRSHRSHQGGAYESCHPHHDSEVSEHINRRKKLIIALLSLFLSFVLIGAAAFFLEGNLSLKGILKDHFGDADEEADANEITLYDETYVINNKFDTFLFMGTDYSGNEEGTEDAYQGSLSDFLMLMVVDHTDNTYAFLPIDRNTMTDVHLLEKDGSGEAVGEEQICTAHWYGGNKQMGCENTMTAVSEYLGDLAIDGYYAISMSEIPRINHAIGGVRVTLKDDFTAQDPEMKQGSTLTLKDSQAEIYLHSRMNVADGTNKNRMERQRTYMAEALKKVKSNLKSNPEYFEEVSESFTDVATSTITGRQTSRAANALAKYDDLGTFDIQGETKLGKELGDGEEHEEFYPDPDSVLEVMTALYHLEKEE